MGRNFERILLATEHSEYDIGAERLAFAMARICGLPLAGILPIVSNPEYEAMAPQIAAHVEAQAAERVRLLMGDARQAGVALELRARRGPEPYREIVEEATERSSDLLVIRRRGKRGLLASLLVGEMVSKVVAHAPCSVLVASRAARMWSSRVLVAVDPAADDSAVVAQAAGVAAECRLPLSIVVVMASDSDAARNQAAAAVQRASTAAKTLNVEVDAHTRSGRPHEQILQAAAASASDLIVVGRHGKDRFARAWLGGVAQKVIGLADQPVLVAVDQAVRKDIA